MSSKKQAADTFAINPHPVFERWHNDEMMIGELPQGEEVGEDIDEEAPEGENDIANELAEEMFPADAGMAVAEAPMNEAQVEAPQAAPDINGRVWPAPDATAVRTTIENNAANGVYFADYMPNYEATLRADNIETLRAHNEALLNRIRGNG